MGQGQLRGVVALDGPAGTGKSTVAKRVAMALDARYLDTGSMYRAIALAVLRAGVDPTDEVKVAAVVETALPLARAVAGGRLVALFQPHLYSRTRDFAAEFALAQSLVPEPTIAFAGLLAGATLVGRRRK